MLPLGGLIMMPCFLGTFGKHFLICEYFTVEKKQNKSLLTL